MKSNFSIIISNTSRSYEYLKCLKKYNFLPKNIIYLNDGLKNSVSRKLKLKKFFFKEIKINEFNSNYINTEVSKFILSLKVKFIIYSGYPGVIEKNKKILKSKNLIHSHSGKIPNYKGSTTIYYSILKEKKIYCSTIILSKNLDDGKILLRKEYPIPKKIYKIDKEYDDHVRSRNIIFLLKNFNKLKLKKKVITKHMPYYVIHPLLRSIVFKKYEKNIKEPIKSRRRL